ncbi:hypothetical protein Tco_0568593 [Tanacetum coccineum]
MGMGWGGGNENAGASRGGGIGWGEVAGGGGGVERGWGLVNVIAGKCGGVGECALSAVIGKMSFLLQL